MSLIFFRIFFIFSLFFVICSTNEKLDCLFQESKNIECADCLKPLNFTELTKDVKIKQLESRTKKYEIEALKRKFYFIKKLTRQINYDGILSEYTNSLFFKANLFCNSLLTEDDTFIFEFLELDHFDLPPFKFYKECFDVGLLNTFFNDDLKVTLLDTASFFLSIRNFMDLLSPETVAFYMDQNDIEENCLEVIMKVILCTKRIIASRTSRISTLEIIKGLHLSKNTFIDKDHLELHYSFQLIQNLLLNETIPHYSCLSRIVSRKYTIIHDAPYVKASVIDYEERKVKQVMSYSSYISSHISYMIYKIVDDYRKYVK